ncbi:hypothetical protein RM844_29910 [Streptomyces sp. DSM 44915]|uniref:DUF6891 domain-containing protein n=1 Tax=Streptomyces chisholmiae TaxID=3075540 RepID=A0ABU2JZS0_9ACTN|nr:hypothetical protein [Streptomyces sp. DSM 44915]MDT0270495.1 hypothetical protein [Streptomyces sp. DSM 44915]
MLEITVRTERGTRVVRPDVRTLARLVGRLGDQEGNFLVLQRVPDLPQQMAQVWHEAGGAYELEHRDGGPAEHFRTVLAAPGPVVDALAGWAAREPEWAAGLSWEPVELPVPAPPPPLELSTEDAKALHEELRRLLWGGYADRDRLAMVAVDYLVRGDERPVSPAQARALADALWVARVEEQAGWTDRTDPERVTDVFAELRGLGITAEENFACCRNCGIHEIGGVSAPDARGYVFFHQQSTDSVVTGGALVLHFGQFTDRVGDTEWVGRQVVAAFGRAGLTAEWDGDPNRAIVVRGLDWRRRLIG